MAKAGSKKITRSDLEASYKTALGQGEETVSDLIPPAVVTAGVAAGFGAFLVFLAGRRRGRKRQSVIEIHRA